MPLQLILGTAQWSGSYGLTRLRASSFDRVAVGEIVSAASSSRWVALDTAPAYGDAESIIGNLGTKLAIHSKFDTSLSPESSLVRSLVRLQTSEVDVMYFHDSRICLENRQVVDQARELVGAGVSHLGSSVYEESEYEAALSTDGIDVIQVPLNPLDRRFCGDRLRTEGSMGRRVIARSIFLQGGLLRNPEELPTQMGHLAPYIAEFQSIASRFEVTPAQLVFSWLSSVGPLAGVVVGVDGPNDVREVTLASTEACDRRAVEMVMEMKVPSWPEVDPRQWA